MLWSAGAPRATAQSWWLRADSGRADSTRAAHWRAQRLAKAGIMQPPSDTWVEDAAQFVARNRSFITPDQLVIDIAALDLYGIKPVFGGLGSGAGFTGGLWYAPPLALGSGRYANVQALASLRGYYGAEAVLGEERPPYIRYAFARYRHQPGELVYPMETRVDEPAAFRLNEGLMGGLIGRYLTPRLLSGLHASYQTYRYGPGRRDGYAQLDTAFTTPLPGQQADVDYATAGGFVAYDGRNIPEVWTYGRAFAPTGDRLRGLSLSATDGLFAAATASYHQDVQGQFSFARATADVQWYVPVRRGTAHAFVLRHYAELTHGRVPFYLMPVLGGARSVRGFGGARFRDQNVMLINAEFRCQVWHWLDMAVFADVGHTFNRFRRIAPLEAHVGYGIGFRVRSNQRVLARFEVAGSASGVTTYLAFGSLL